MNTIASSSKHLAPETAAKPWYRHRWPWLLMAGPALVIVAGSYTMWLAVTREDAMVVGDYYKEGPRHQPGPAARPQRRQPRRGPAPDL